MKQKCFRCKRSLFSYQFYKDKNGCPLICKNCLEDEIKKVKKLDNKEQKKVLRRFYYQKPEVNKRNRLRNSKWRKENPEKYRFSSCKGGAKARDLQWDLTFEQFMMFWRKPCFYCGSEIETIGLDRIDNKKGYVLDNVVSCCLWCNNWKGIMSQDDFLSHCHKIVKTPRQVQV